MRNKALTTTVGDDLTSAHTSGLQAINLTQAAINYVKSHLFRRGRGIGIRVGIKKGGCSHFKYDLQYVDQQQPQDYVFKIDNELAIYVDPKSYYYVKGATLDYVKQGLNNGLSVINPNEKSRCGCGESFLT